jgi:hypothetical protein
VDLIIVNSRPWRRCWIQYRLGTNLYSFWPVGNFISVYQNTIILSQITQSYSTDYYFKANFEYSDNTVNFAEADIKTMNNPVYSWVLPTMTATNTTSSGSPLKPRVDLTIVNSRPWTRCWIQYGTNRYSLSPVGNSIYVYQNTITLSQITQSYSTDYYFKANFAYSDGFGNIAEANIKTMNNPATSWVRPTMTATTVIAGNCSMQCYPQVVLTIVNSRRWTLCRIEHKVSGGNYMSNYRDYTSYQNPFTPPLRSVYNFRRLYDFRATFTYSSGQTDTATVSIQTPYSGTTPAITTPAITTAARTTPAITQASTALITATTSVVSSSQIISGISTPVLVPRVDLIITNTKRWRSCTIGYKSSLLYSYYLDVEQFIFNGSSIPPDQVNSYKILYTYSYNKSYTFRATFTYSTGPPDEVTVTILTPPETTAAITTPLVNGGGLLTTGGFQLR